MENTVLPCSSSMDDTQFVTKATPIGYIDSKLMPYKKLKGSRTCFIGYSGLISCEWCFIAWGLTHPYTDFPPACSQHVPGLKSVLYFS